MENVKQKIKVALESMSYDEKVELMKIWKGILPEPKAYECIYYAGYRGSRNYKRLYVKSAKWNDSQDAILVEFSSDPCIIDESLANVSSALIHCAKNRRFFNYEVYYGSLDLPAPTEEVT